ncbi:MAG: hypothetical protein ACRDBM_09365 [Sporomusa sp.]
MVWPQITIIVLFILSVIVSTVNHDKEAKCNAYVAFFRMLLWGWILYEGGFWNVLIGR